MTFLERLADLQYRALDRLRDPHALEAVARPATAVGFGHLRGARQCLVVTFKRSGEAVPTPVNFGLGEDGLLYFRSEPRSAKVQRLRRDPRVRVAACDLRGKPLGPLAPGTARVLDPRQSDRADAIVASNWTPGMRMLERGLDRLPIEVIYVEVTPSDQMPDHAPPAERD
jgi:uncharacterized protein